MRVLITGAAGFIGSHLLQRFGSQHLVLGVDNFDSFYPRAIKDRNVQETGLSERVVEADLLDVAKVDSLFHDFQPELVLHIAARAGVRPSIQDPALYMRHNVEATTNVYECCRKYEVGAVILASSSSVYGVRNQVPFREDEPVTSPQSPYAASKISSELIAGTYARLYGIRTAILRFFTVYGPRQRPDLAISSFARKMLSGDPIPVYGDGSTERDYTFIADIVDGVHCAAEWVVTTPKGHYDVFNLGESRMVKLTAMIEALEQALGCKAVREYRPLQPGDVPRTCADISKARSILGYDPKVDLEEGLAVYAKWIKGRKNEFS